MRTIQFALAAALVVAACGGNRDARGIDETQPADSAAMREAMREAAHGDTTRGGMMGDMTTAMPHMNQMMVGMLGAADAGYEQRFIDMMVPHHQGAIAMSEDALQKAVHPELKQFAQRVIDAQRAEIAEMKRLRQTWYGDSAIAMMTMHGDSSMGMGMSSDVTMDQMNTNMTAHLGAADSSYDARFIDMMIPHHQGAVMMADDAQAKATKPELKAMASKMIADQKKEIAQLEKWRAAWYGR